MRPVMISLVGERDLVTGLAADVRLYNAVAAGLFVLAVPQRRVQAVARPGRIEIGARAVAQLVKARAVGVNDKDLALPVGRDGIVLRAAKADEHVVGLRPGRFKIHIAAGDRVAVRIAGYADVNLAVAVIGN